MAYGLFFRISSSFDEVSANATDELFILKQILQIWNLTKKQLLLQLLLVLGCRKSHYPTLSKGDLLSIYQLSKIPPFKPHLVDF